MLDSMRKFSGDLEGRFEQKISKLEKKVQDNGKTADSQIKKKVMKR